jgi:cytochrome oxidase Cu insertion factor (SCO1/SenC/PrrC family)
MRPSRPAAVVLAMILVAACGSSEPDASSATAPAPPATADTAAAPMGPAATSAPAPSPTAAPSSGASAATPPATTATATETTTSVSAPAVELAAWQTLPITDVDGTTFTLADLAGKPVLVETFATWCSKCRAQLGDTNRAAGQLGETAHVVALSVETDLDSSTVADYAVDAGFDRIRFAVMSPDMLAALVDAYGNTVVNPPATPKIIVDAAGRAGELTTGSERLDELVAQVAAAG